MKEVADAVEVDTGNLSRIENAKQTVSRELAERLAAYYGHEVTEMQIIYPERYMTTPPAQASIEATPTAKPRRRHDDPKLTPA